jgi:hypothetical protein
MCHYCCWIGKKQAVSPVALMLLLPLPCGFATTNEAIGQKILARGPNECQYSWTPQLRFWANVGIVLDELVQYCARQSFAVALVRCAVWRRIELTLFFVLRSIVKNVAAAIARRKCPPPLRCPPDHSDVNLIMRIHESGRSSIPLC